MSKIPISDIDDVIFNPTRYFTDPEEVIECNELEFDQKVALLFNWEWDIKQMQVAEEENMQGPTVDYLDKIKKALIALGITADVGHTGTNKFGGL